ncbi:unnamed protein product, partial [Pylaiella littoralis]
MLQQALAGTAAGYAGVGALYRQSPYASSVPAAAAPLLATNSSAAALSAIPGYGSNAGSGLPSGHPHLLLHQQQQQHHGDPAYAAVNPSLMPTAPAGGVPAYNIHVLGGGGGATTTTTTTGGVAGAPSAGAAAAMAGAG